VSTPMGITVITPEMAQRSQDDPLAHGVAAALVKAAAHQAASSHEVASKMRGYLEPHLAEVMDVLIAGAKRGKRTALNGLIRLATASNASEDVLRALAIAIGAQSVQHMRQAAVAGLDAENVDEATLWAQAEQHAQEYRREHGLPPLIEDPQFTTQHNGRKSA